MCFFQVYSNLGPKLNKQPLFRTHHTHGKGHERGLSNEIKFEAFFACGIYHLIPFHSIPQRKSHGPALHGAKMYIVHRRGISRQIQMVQIHSSHRKQIVVNHNSIYHKMSTLKKRNPKTEIFQYSAVGKIRKNQQRRLRRSKQ